MQGEVDRNALGEAAAVAIADGSIPRLRQLRLIQREAAAILAVPRPGGPLEPMTSDPLGERVSMKAIHHSTLHTSTRSLCSQRPSGSLSVVVLLSSILLSAPFPVAVARNQEKVPELLKLEGKAIPAQQTSETGEPLPFRMADRVGEKLSFHASWAKYLAAARMTLEVRPSDSEGNPNELKLRAFLQTVGVVRSLILPVDDELISHVNAKTVQPRRFQARIREGKREAQHDSIIKSGCGGDGSESQESGPSQSTEPSRDPISLLYYLRTLSWEKHRSYRLRGFYPEPKDQFIIVASYEESAPVETGLGRFDAPHISLKGVGPDGALHDQWRLRIALTNDARRLPVLITASPNFGGIRVELTNDGRLSEETSPPAPTPSGEKPPPTKSDPAGQSPGAIGQPN